MKTPLLLLLAAGFTLAHAASKQAASLQPIVPKYRGSQVLLSSAEQQGMTYLAFPSLLRLGPEEVLIPYKLGYRHGGDTEARGEVLRYDTGRNVVVDRRVIADTSGLIFQMGEPVRFPNDDVAVYFDVQTLGADGRNYRAGMRETRSRDGGRTFGAVQRAPLVDGREYGYPFDFIVQGDTTYMLVMAFGYRPGDRWSVDVVQSRDNGRTWSFVRNLTEEFGGHRINESAFLPWGDGFLVTTRAYGDSQRLYRTDRTFRKLAEADLSEANAFMESHIGRPRLFERDGGVYLMGRNWRTTPPQGRKMELALFKLDPATLRVTRWVLLDNSERGNVTDAYYAVPYFEERNGRTWLNVITYRGYDGEHPDLLRLEYDWAEVK